MTSLQLSRRGMVFTGLCVVSGFTVGLLRSSKVESSPLISAGEHNLHNFAYAHISTYMISL
jgi:hypothetical protein